MRVSKVADIVEGNVVPTVKDQAFLEVAAILSNVAEVVDPHPDFNWELGVTLGKDSAARSVRVPLHAGISHHDSLTAPVLLGGGRLVYFRNRLFRCERPPVTPSEHEEVLLRVKKAVYDEENEVAQLRAAVANCEAASEFAQLGTRREPISDEVKMVVWARDGGACVRCGSKQNLHFDHVIPVAKGGGNIANNIQVLCQICNLRKSDKIAAP